MTNGDFAALSKQAGFEHCYFLPPVKLETRLSKLVADPIEVLPGAKTVILLIKTYALGESSEEADAVISGYYPASNSAYIAAKELSARLSQMGFRAVSNVQLPLKKWLNAFGIGQRGANSLISIKGLGSLFNIQAIVTDAEFEYTASLCENESINPICISCQACVRACPMRAIKPGGEVDAQRCLRAISEMDPIPRENERLLGNRVLGCDVCQEVCPLNAGLKRKKPLTVSLEKLLMGDIEELRRLIGTNYARVNKLKKKAAVIAANTGRQDLIPHLRIMAQENDEGLKSAALHAMERLEVNE